MLEEYRLDLLLELRRRKARGLDVVVRHLAELRELISLVLYRLVEIAVELLVEGVLAACLLVALDDNLVVRLDEEDSHCDVGLGLEALPRAEYLREHIARPDVDGNSYPVDSGVGLAAQVDELRYQLWRDIVYAVIADILHNVHNARFTRA